MNTSSKYLSHVASPVLRLLLIGSMVTTLAGVGRATTFYWDSSGSTATQGGNGTWDTVTANWDSSPTGGTLGVYTPNTTPSTGTANFGGSGATAGASGGALGAVVTLAATSTINVNNVTFSNTATTSSAAAYTIAGGTGSVLNFSGTSANEPTISFANNVAGAETISANLTNDAGTGLVINYKGSSNVLNLTGNNSGLTGTTTVNLQSGTLGVSAPGTLGASGLNNAFGTSTIMITSTGQINFRSSTAGTVNYGNNVIINGGNATFNVGATGTQHFTFGTLTFDTANQFIGAGSINPGNIVFSNVVLAANGTFSFGGAVGGQATVGAITQSSGTFSFTVTGGSGATSLLINGASSNSGGTIITANTITDGIANGVSTSGTLTVGTTGVSSFNLNGFNQTVAGLANTVAGASSSIQNSATGASVLTYNGATSTYGGILKDAGAGKTLGLTMAAGNLTLTGTNTNIGATQVTGGTLAIGTTGSLAAGSAVTLSGGVLNVAGKVNGTVALNNGGTLSGNGGTIGALTVAGGGIINTVDGVIGTLNGSTLALNGNATLGLEINTGSTADELVFSGAATIGASDVFTVNVTALNGVNAGTYVIASASTGLVAADFSAGSLTNLTGYTATFTQGTGDTIDLVIQSSNPASNSYYFNGANSGSFTDAGNYVTTAGGGTSQTGNALSATSNVFLDANSASNTPPTLASTATINSLTFVTAGETLSGGGNLTIAATGTAGITDSATGGTTETVAPTVTLGSSQGWTVSSATNTLAITGGIAGTSSQTLTLNGPGKYVFSSGATGASFAGNTTLATGSLLITNTTGSALGSGTFTVARGANFGGSGIAHVAAFNIGSGSSGITQIQVGNGLDTSSKLQLSATGASTISNANLTFNLSTTSTAANQLNLGNTGITFSNTTLTLNMTGGQVVAPDTAYVLITDANGFAGSGITTDANGVITGGLSIAANSFFGSESNGFSSGFYSGSYLFIGDGGTEIEVEVVPEPGTWALMLGGLGVLFFWQRRRKALRA
jgi:fibronectin-binding autotransporter adhesin